MARHFKVCIMSGLKTSNIFACIFIILFTKFSLKMLYQFQFNSISPTDSFFILTYCLGVIDSKKSRLEHSEYEFACRRSEQQDTVFVSQNIINSKRKLVLSIQIKTTKEYKVGQKISIDSGKPITTLINQVTHKRFTVKNVLFMFKK